MWSQSPCCIILFNTASADGVLIKRTGSIFLFSKSGVCNRSLWTYFVMFEHVHAAPELEELMAGMGQVTGHSWPVVNTCQE
jgi:hypothetical protein